MYLNTTIKTPVRIRVKGRHTQDLFLNNLIYIFTIPVSRKQYSCFT